MPKGGALEPVYAISSDDLEINGGHWKLAGRVAIPVRGYDQYSVGDLPVKQGPARVVYPISQSDLEENGGDFKLMQGRPIKVLDFNLQTGETLGARKIRGGPAIPVYPVLDDSRSYDGAWPFSPLSIEGLKLWLAADRIAGLSDGDPVGTWSDLSGNGNDATQATAAKKPTFKTDIVNGKPVVRFDGVDDLLVIAGQTFTGSQGMVWAVIRLASPIGEKGYILASFDELDSVYGIGMRPYHDATSPYARIYQTNNDIADFVEGDTTIAASTSYIMSWRSDGSQYYIDINGAGETISVVSGANSGDWFADSANRDNVAIGAAKTVTEVNFLKGDIAELCYYEPMPNASQRSRLNRYASNKYGITLS